MDYFFTVSRPALRPTQPLIQGVPGTLSPQVKKPGHEANHFPPFSVMVKNVHGVVLGSAEGQLYLTYKMLFKLSGVEL